ncbi:pyridoxal phosphate-dependent aminotransferase [Halovivax limisalsi]|uniref:pyridoxal phosphate-dependent aminotransferase n=1 Tax=Halovivax limisalsi TaxID=1453760 RepID=UPI001FFCE51C|nr:pyridoxal phosphate-dependent aminotransferase [Halovivax limisalsi]
MIDPADRVTAVDSSGIREFFEIAAERDDVISLSVGEPDVSLAPAVRTAAIESIESDRTNYTANRGMRELREAIADHVERYDLTVEPEAVLVTAGASEAIDLALRALVDPGDVVAMAEPSYVSYPSGVTFSGGEVLPVETSPDEGFELSVERLRAAGAEAADLLLLNYPNNPTGRTYDRSTLAEIAAFAREHDLAVVADEIYAPFTYDREHVSIASLPGMAERTVVINGFSKAYAMTGFRLGYAIGPTRVVDAMNRIHQYTMLSAPTTAQHAALAALESGDDAVAETVATYDDRRRVVTDRLAELGFDCADPNGAFYAFPRIPGGGDDTAFARDLLEDAGVAVVPGSAFGTAGEGHVRLSYAASRSQLAAAFERIETFLRDRPTVAARE